MKANLYHLTHYIYDRPVRLGPQIVRLHSRPETKTHLENEQITVIPSDAEVSVRLDDFGNKVWSISTPNETRELKIEVTSCADIVDFNPYDFELLPHVRSYPFSYSPADLAVASPYLVSTEGGSRLGGIVDQFQEKKLHTIDLVAGVTKSIKDNVRNIVRSELGVLAPEETLKQRSGASRDSAWLLVHVFRKLGIASRFVSGYSIKTKSREMPPPIYYEWTSVEALHLHAWCEVYLPGGGWIGVDATTGLFTFGDCVALACGPHFSDANAVSGGYYGEANVTYHFEMRATTVASTVAADASRAPLPAVHQNPLGKLAKMRGLPAVKSEIKSLHALASAEQRRRALGSSGTSVSLHLIFTGNPGTGKTSVARLIGEIYREVGLLKSGHVVEVDRSMLVGQYIGHTAVQTNNKIREALDGVLFIDEAYSLWREGSENDFGIEAIEAVMKGMEDNRERLAVIVAGYAPQMRRFIEANPGLKSRFTRTLHFDDYDKDDLVAIFREIASTAAINLSESAVDRLDQSIAEMVRVKDENFGNARDIRTLFERTMERQAHRLQASPTSDPHVVEVDDIPTVNRSITKDFPALLEQLNQMVGLASVKSEVKRLMSVARTNKRRAEEGMPPMPLSLHMVFTGNPGTGKTTVARIVGEMLAALGLLANGHVIETDRSGLVSGVPGGTALKTQRTIKDALNGVLFIDEAYTLARSDETGFGQEAIDTLLKEMEDKRDRLAVIVAGYPEEMKQFLVSNPGLVSRFTRFVHFDDYSPMELAAIFESIARSNGMILSEAVNEQIYRLCEDLFQGKSTGFGNGRAIRRLFERTLENQAERLIEESEADLREIQAADLPRL